MTPGRFGLLFAVAMLGAAGCSARGEAGGGGASDGEISMQPERVGKGDAKVVEVQERELPQAVFAAGRVTFDDQRVQHVSSPVAGRVVRVLAEPGQRVRRGSSLVALLSHEAAGVFADVLRAEAELAQASADLTRQRRLVTAEAGRRRDLDAAEDSHRKAEAELARAKQRASMLRSGEIDAVTQELILKSAIDGEVISRAVSPGMELQGASSGGAAEIFTIGDIDRVSVLAEFAEQDLARVLRGATATVRVPAWPERSFRGDVQWIASELDPAARTGRVRISLPNPDHALKPEMLAQVSIEAPPRRGLVLPRKALISIQGESFAYVADGETGDARFRFKRRRVRVAGDAAEEIAVVEDGVKAGDRVLVEDPSPRDLASPDVLLTASQLAKAGIRMERVAEQDLAGELTAGARLSFADVAEARVFSPVSGRVVRVLAEPGQRVRKGAPLLVMASPEVGVAFADAVKARAELVAAEHEFDRQRELVEAHAGARKDLEASEAAFRKARAELDRARQKASLLAAGTWDAVRQEYTLRSPIDGEVLARAAAPGLEVQGQWAGASAPLELFAIGSLDPLWVMGELYEMDLPHVRRGEQVAVRVTAYPERTFHGRIDWMSDLIDPATRTAKFRCAIANPGNLLRPEMAPVVSLALPARRRAVVQRAAVLRLGDEMAVFVHSGTMPDGRLAFRRRKVIVGESGPSGMVAVLDGLAAGEEVVTSGSIFLVGLL